VVYCALDNEIGEYSHDLQRMNSPFDPNYYSKTNFDAALVELEQKRADFGNFRYAACRAHSLIQLIYLHKISIRERVESVIAF
jgi:hypothetical protein